MSKSIYEEALESLKKYHEITDMIKEIKAFETALKQAQKQEKLLELYRELNNKILYTYDIFERMTNKEWTKFVNLQQQIKELENEK